MTSFVEKNRDFVFKLKISKVDGETQIRRVCLPRISDGNGGISYEDLISLVVAYSKDSIADDKSTEKYVSLTYYDDEKDLITIASTEELMDAVALFSGQKFMRITTCVKNKMASSVSSTPAVATAAGASPSAENGTSTHEDYPPGPAIKLVLESFAGILSNAVNHLQEGLATQAPATGKPENTQEVSSSPNLGLEESTAPRSTEATSVTKGSNRNNKKVPKAVRAKAYEMSDKSVSGGISAPRPAGTYEKEETEETKPFIHGRHTCDACLSTPIVGKRYHATNLPDYDLCQNCFDNYKGSEIKFDAVQLDRDAPFQERWHGRYQRTVMMMKRRGRSGRGGCGPRGRRFRGRNHGNVHPHRRVTMGSRARPETAIRGHDQSPSKGHHDPSTPGPLSRKISSDSNAHLDQSKGDVKSPSSLAKNSVENFDFDNALKEAIRRSLDDVAPKEVPMASCCNVKETKENEDVSQKVFKCGGEKNTEESTVSVKDIPRSVEIEEQEESDKGSCDGNCVMDTSSFSEEIKEVEAMEKSMETGSVDSEKLLLKLQEPGTIPSHIDATIEKVQSEHSSSERKSLNNIKEASFASDAVGNGDIAEVMGKTLDLVAGVIGEMLSESDDLKPSENQKESVNENKTDEFFSNSNEIVHEVAEYDDEEIVENDDTDWSVVKSVGSTGSGQIGKATELLGSALFNSDMKSSIGENGSDLMGSGSTFSIPSSVPTDLGTQHSRVAAVAQADRWASELEKLKELGFCNEARCIEILEKIESTNSEMDSSERALTNIDLVVNELLEMN